jgi:hypothetical protein
MLKHFLSFSVTSTPNCTPHWESDPILKPIEIDNYLIFDFLWKQFFIFCKILLPFGAGGVDVWNAVDVSSSWRQALSPEIQLLQVSSIVGQLSRSWHSDRAVLNVNHSQLSKLLQRRRHSSADSISSEWKATFVQEPWTLHMGSSETERKIVSLLLYNIYSGQNVN